MSTHRQIDRICAAAAVLSLLLTLLVMNGETLGISSASTGMGYEARLFDTSRVHTIDIVMDDWDSFIQTCENEEYAACAAVIDGEAWRNTAIRAKGNTSLSAVSQMGSDRYSFKIEFDHYDSGSTYYGLDKLSLNNVIQDNTYMKDYLTYQMMGAFGAAAPLCSYVYLTVNGQDWGLYLAVEGVEDGFLQRCYGRDHGALYKPDSMSFGGGRGNGRDFSMDDFAGGPGGDAGAQRPSGGMAGGMGSSDVKLQYIDDDPDSYANIFDSAKTEVTEADQARLIQSLKTLSEGGDVSGVVDVDQVLRYFVVHNFVVNGDSYTGSMVHNYYLYEQDGRLSMIPWDYNLAFGTFQAGDASAAVNDPIDSPLSVTGSGDRPMIDWIFASEEYTRLYHQYFQEFLDRVDCAAVIERARALIAPYVERDPTKFCTYEEFEAGVEALKTFCALRADSVSGQLAGTIPSTAAGQSADPASLTDASSLTLSDMGTMDNGGGRGGGPFGGEDASGAGDGVPAFGPGAGGLSRPEGGAGPLPSAEGGGSAGAPGGGLPEDGRPQEGSGGGFPGAAPGGDAAQAGGPLLLGVSALALLLGLAAAFKFKR